MRWLAALDLMGVVGVFSEEMDQVDVFQFLWADAIFVRDFTKLNLHTLDLFLKVAVILHDMYFSYGLALLFPYAYDSEMETTFSDPYREKLSEFQCASWQFAMICTHA